MRKTRKRIDTKRNLNNTFKKSTFSSINKEKTRKNTNVKSFKQLRCSPTNGEKKYTCYSDSDLYKMRDIWNARNGARFALFLLEF